MDIKMQYTCGYCKNFYDTKEECNYCMGQCTKLFKKEEDVKPKLLPVRHNLYVLKADSYSDVESTEFVLGGNISSSDYEDYSYPAKLVIVKREFYDQWDGYEETSLDIFLMDDYIKKERNAVEIIVSDILNK